MKKIIDMREDRINLLTNVNQNLDWIIGNITDDGRIRIYYVTIKGFYRMFFSQRGFGFRSKENSELNEVLKYLCLIFIEK